MCVVCQRSNNKSNVILLHYSCALLRKAAHFGDPGYSPIKLAKISLNNEGEAPEWWVVGRRKWESGWNKYSPTYLKLALITPLTLCQCHAYMEEDRVT